MRTYSKSRNHRRASKTWLTLLIMVMVLDMLLYNFVYLFPIARAEGETTEEVTQEEPAAEVDSTSSPQEEESEEPEETPAEETAEEEDSTSSPQETTNTEEPAATTPETTPGDTGTPTEITEPVATTENSEPTDSEETWRTCELNDTEKENIEKDICGECRELPDCSEIIKCIAVKVENTNTTDIDNTAAATSDTGNNTAGDDENSDEENSEADETDSDEETAENEAEPSPCDNPDNNCPCITDAQTGEAEIATGDAAAGANVVNEANTNITGNNYIELVLNIEDGTQEDVNLLEEFEKILEEADEEGAESLEVTNENTADIDNEVTATANTGNNEAEGQNADIETGDATAVANLVNIVNTNIVGNNWLFAVVNVLGDWVGNLILPGYGLLNVPDAGGQAALEVVNENEANVNNEATATANTGENSVEGNGGQITTGDAASASLVSNIVNTNIIRNNWLYLVINNMGVWTGQVLGWDDGENSNVYTYDFDLAGEADALSGYLSVHNQNTANVNNVVTADANTGGNTADGRNAEINTGDATAISRIFNFINTNIVGNNWLFSIVNVMGNWQGDAEFAYPDLSVDISSDQDKVEPGESFHYTVSYKNNGKARSENTRLALSLPSHVNYLGSSDGDSGMSEGMIHWDLNGLKPGEEESITVNVSLNKKLPKGLEKVESAAGVATDTKETETGNNYGTIATWIDYSNIEISDDEIGPEIKNGLDISRSVSPAGPYHAGDLVTHAILVRNRTKGTVYNLVVTETVKDPNGNVLGEVSWPIEKLKRGQKALIQYQVVVNAAAMSGTYQNSAKALSNDKDGNIIKSKKSVISYQIIGGVWGSGEENNGEGEIVPAAATIQEETPGNILGAGTGQPFEFPLWAWVLALIGLLAVYERKRIAALKWEKAWAWAQAVKNAIFSFLF